MARSCPVCFSFHRSSIYESTFTFGGAQTVWNCEDCGMLYSETTASADYVDSSPYAKHGAIGSGENPTDAARHVEIAEWLKKYVPLDATICDVGCARGGLLRALREAGYRHVAGIDPSPACVETVRGLGFEAEQATLADLPEKQEDHFIVSHVLEHVPDVTGSLLSLRRRLRSGGSIYIEVPDAARYSEFRGPFLDFVPEHINHFSRISLRNAMTGAGLRALAIENAIVPQANGTSYGVLRSIAVAAEMPKDRDMQAKAREYVAISQEQLARVNDFVARGLSGKESCIVWGASHFLAHLLQLPAMQGKRIVQIVDKNPEVQGRHVAGVKIQSPSDIKTPEPIVIASMLFTGSIRSDIERLGLKNDVVTVV